MADTNFENLKFDPINNNSLLLDNLSDPDFNLFSQNFETINTPYFHPEDLASHLTCDKSNSFSVLHVNVRSLSKNFSKLKLFCLKLVFNLK